MLRPYLIYYLIRAVLRIRDVYPGGPGSGFFNNDSGIQGQKGTESRITDPNPRPGLATENLSISNPKICL